MLVYSNFTVKPRPNTPHLGMGCCCNVVFVCSDHGIASLHSGPVESVSWSVSWFPRRRSCRTVRLLLPLLATHSTDSPLEVSYSSHLRHPKGSCLYHKPENLHIQNRCRSHRLLPHTLSLLNRCSILHCLLFATSGHFLDGKML